ncbi:asparagine synthase (glutamine-hydrolyzing) [bacterium]|nr:asparagine synthase (glutamine-hydrolyzing) [bacterium]
MCGIAGFVNTDRRPADPAILAAMTSAITHRGPDAAGYWIEDETALGHRRLSIIDVGGGAQPMTNEDGSVWVVYNGETYNEPKIRKDLIARGHAFRNESDTECLVHLYEDHGPDFVRFLNGMFAFAIWDRSRKRLVLARDRMGQKPLYWHQAADGSILFASEPKAILSHPGYSRAIDRDSLARYFFYEYFPWESSIWAGIRKLRPGHVLVWEDGKIEIREYWRPRFSLHPQGLDPEERQANDPLPVKFWNRFRDAVDRHRRSDVPLGVFLSGGVDSSAVAAALVELQGPDRVATFSIGFDEKSFDESSQSRAVAKFLGTRHNERIFGVDTLIGMISEVADWCDEPFGDASLLPTHLLSRFAREQVTVALGGDGADELMAGYPTFTAEPWRHRYESLPGWMRACVAGAVRRLPVRHTNFSLDFKARQFMKGAGCPPAIAHQRWLGSFDSQGLRGLLIDAPDFDPEEELQCRLDQEAGDFLTTDDRLLYQYQSTYLPEDILLKVDRASMATSLEVRAPFLDADLVDWVAGLPYDVKRRGRCGKWLLKQAMHGKVPEFVTRRAKKGFGIPVAAWLRGPLRSWMTDWLGSDRIRRQGLFDDREVQRLVDEHLLGVRDHRKPIWTLLVFQIWYDRWLEAGVSSPLPAVGSGR